MSENPYQPVNSEIVDIIDESPTIKTFVVVPKEKINAPTGIFRIQTPGLYLLNPGHRGTPKSPDSNSH